VTDYPKIAARFARDTADHEMTVLREDGLYRHLRFAALEGYNAFDLITWKHKLVITGDGKDFLFSLYPTEDLFEMFRRTAQLGEINPGYWQEKVLAGRDELKVYDDELLRREIADTVKAWTDKMTEEQAKGIRAAVEDHFFGEMADYNVEYESEAQRALRDFLYDKHVRARCACGESERFDSWWDADQWKATHLAKPAPEHSGKHPVSIYQTGYQFDDWSEWRLRDYSPHFLWACHAIRWGIAQYDAAKAAPKAVSA
jgi:hypothetical protein